MKKPALVDLVRLALAAALLIVCLRNLAYGGEADTLPRRPCDAQAAAMRPAVPKTTGVPELDDLLREAKRRNATVAQQFNEDGVGLTWFKATPDGWLSRIPPPVPASPPVQAPPRVMAPEVAAPRAPFRNGQPVWHEGHRCPNCNYESPDGEGTWVIRGGNPSGVHAHECPRCHTRWVHSR